MKKVLVVEDEQALGRLVELHLKDLGCAVTRTTNGTQGLELALTNRYDLIVLDIMLPGIDGLEICQQVRRGTAYTPILMLTAKSDDIDRVLGLEVGADDYLTKPFNIRELMARVKAIFRRVDALGKRRNGSAPLSVGSLVIDEARRSAVLEDRPLQLTAKEFDLLLHFAQNPGRVYTRTDLLDKVWGYGQGGYEHTVNSHINRLRSKIEVDPAQPRYILTVWGVGYKFFDPRETAG